MPEEVPTQTLSDDYLETLEKVKKQHRQYVCCGLTDEEIAAVEKI